MKIRNVIHKQLRRLVQDDDGAGLPADLLPKLRAMVAFLQDMGTVDELHTLPTWKAHLLAGTRKGTWALHVTRNWRLTFLIDSEEIEVFDLNYEDYH